MTTNPEFQAKYAAAIEAIDAVSKGPAVDQTRRESLRRLGVLCNALAELIPVPEDFKQLRHVRVGASGPGVEGRFNPETGEWLETPPPGTFLEHRSASIGTFGEGQVGFLALVDRAQLSDATVQILVKRGGGDEGWAMCGGEIVVTKDSLWEMFQRALACSRTSP